jgi:SNF2 family DNA or RNA helicase
LESKDFQFLINRCKISDNEFDLSKFFHDLDTADNDQAVFKNKLFSYVSNFDEEFKKLQLRERLILPVPYKANLDPRSRLSNTSINYGRSHSLSELLAIHNNPDSVIPLLPFQTIGVDWLLERDRRLLADDMGLGKTIQAISAIERLLKNSSISRVLIVVPRSLILNWLSEFEKWAPLICVTALNPTRKNAKVMWNQRIGKSHVILTSFEQVRNNANLMKPHTELIVVDEAHRIRNSDSTVSKSFRMLTSQKLWLLTGTPVERDAEDLATLMSILEPTKFSIGDQGLGLGLLRHRSELYILRRRKTEVLKELPQLTERHELISLSPEQAESYINELGKSGTNVLYKLGKLLQICDLDPITQQSSKISRIIDLIQQIKSIDERAVVFSFWRAPLLLLEEKMKDLGLPTQLLIGDMNLSERQTALDSFKNGNSTLLASARIASEGLTLTEANHAIFLNRWWNPSANWQAQDRIRRIGQNRPTTTYTFSAEGTVEQVVSRILSDKTATVNTLIEMLSEDFKIVSESNPNLSS